MKRHPLKLDHALLALPDLHALAPLREALIGTSRVDPEWAGTGSAPYAMLGQRRVSLDDLEAAVPDLVEAVRKRAESSFRHVLRAMRALESGDAAGAAGELIRAGEVAEAVRAFEEAERFYERAVQLGRKPRDRKMEGLAWRRLARVARARGEWRRAQEEYGHSLEVATAMRDAAGIVLGYQGIGNVLVDQGRWAEARAWYLRAVEALPDAPSADLLHLCNALSVVERRLGDLEASERWLLRGEAAAKEVADEAAVSYLEHGRARLLMARKDWTGAEELLQRTLSRALDPAARTSALLNLAEPVQEQGRLREAERLVREAEELAIRNRVTPYLPYVYRALGELALRRRDGEGFLFFEQALSAIRDAQLPAAEEAAALVHYARFEAALGQREPAVARLEIACDLYRAVGADVELREAEAELRALTSGEAGQ